jgi:hypothetical protein
VRIADAVQLQELILKELKNYQQHIADSLKCLSLSCTGMQIEPLGLQARGRYKV